ncbi:hypothetical protein CDD83_10921 [Cordyceps sp. RAO-2017]|nr:hypothetical protein CDD83_10921 [Cordyceps sp. RAO-2017]
MRRPDTPRASNPGNAAALDRLGRLAGTCGLQGRGAGSRRVGRRADRVCPDRHHPARPGTMAVDDEGVSAVGSGSPSARWTPKSTGRSAAHARGPGGKVQD